jgi:hypothetical protein
MGAYMGHVNTMGTGLTSTTGGRGERAAKKSEASVARDLGARGSCAPALSDFADVRTRTECAAWAWAWAYTLRRLREAERFGTPAFETIGRSRAPCLIDGMRIADSKATGHLRVRGAMVSATARGRAWRRCRSAGGSTASFQSFRCAVVLELYRSPRNGLPPPGAESSGPSCNPVEAATTKPSTRRGRLQFMALDPTVDTGSC